MKNNESLKSVPCSVAVTIFCAFLLFLLFFPVIKLSCHLLYLICQNLLLNTECPQWAPNNPSHPIPSLPRVAIPYSLITSSFSYTSLLNTLFCLVNQDILWSEWRTIAMDAGQIKNTGGAHLIISVERSLVTLTMSAADTLWQHLLALCSSSKILFFFIFSKSELVCFFCAVCLFSLFIHWGHQNQESKVIIIYILQLIFEKSSVLFSGVMI